MLANYFTLSDGLATRTRTTNSPGFQPRNSSMPRNSFPISIPRIRTNLVRDLVCSLIFFFLFLFISHKLKSFLLIVSFFHLSYFTQTKSREKELYNNKTKRTKNKKN